MRFELALLIVNDIFDFILYLCLDFLLLSTANDQDQ